MRLMTEREYEFAILFTTRLAVLCGTNDPTPAQSEIAAQEAHEEVKRLIAEGKIEDDRP